MQVVIRSLRPDEFDSFMLFLERSYGHSRGLFVREYPHLYAPREDFCRNFMVAEEDGRIAAHVGIFPMTVLAGDILIPLAGIGGVATAPECRGRNHMSTLLRHAIRRMRAEGYAVSGLGGDRQRYNAFGWEWSGLVYGLRFTTRSMTKAGVRPAAVREVFSDEAIPVIEGHQRSMTCRVERHALDLLVKKQNLRFWISDDGYVIGAGENRFSHSFLEVASTAGAEPELIMGAMERLYAGEGTIMVSAWAGGALARLMRCAASWTGYPDWCYRIVSLERLFERFRPLIEKRAEALADFECSLAIRDEEFPEAVTVCVRGGRLEIQSGIGARPLIELDAVSAARVILGGPEIQADVPPGLKNLLPLPLHVPQLDHV